MYYISRNYKSIFDAAGKAKIDCEFALKNLGFKNLGFTQSSIPNSTIGTIKNFFGISYALLRLPFKSTICTQYPNNKFRKLILTVARLKKCKIITIVHDVKSLKGRAEHIEKELAQIILSDVIIVHNNSMKQWFLENNTPIPIIVLGVFDYVSKHKPNQNLSNIIGKQYNIAYAGGFSKGKNSYIYDFDILENHNYCLKLYGVGFNSNNRKIAEEKSVIEYLGSFPSDQIAYSIKADFGLIWDGVSTTSCSGQYGAYLKYNNPHKTSLYILCGIPIIVWRSAAIATFVEEHKIGICVDNLKNLNSILGNLSLKEYNVMKANVYQLQDKVSRGGFVNDAVTKSLLLLKNN